MTDEYGPTGRVERRPDDEPPDIAYVSIGVAGFTLIAVGAIATLMGLFVALFAMGYATSGLDPTAVVAVFAGIGLMVVSGAQIFTGVHVIRRRRWARIAALVFVLIGLGLAGLAFVQQLATIAALSAGSDGVPTDQLLWPVVLALAYGLVLWGVIAGRRYFS